MTDPKPTPNDMIAVLQDASTLLTERGWTQHLMYGSKGELCLGAAIDLACRRRLLGGDAWQYVAIEVMGGSPHALWELSYWNDRPERTVLQVLERIQDAQNWINAASTVDT